MLLGLAIVVLCAGAFKAEEVVEEQVLELSEQNWGYNNDIIQGLSEEDYEVLNIVKRDEDLVKREGEDDEIVADEARQAYPLPGKYKNYRGGRGVRSVKGQAKRAEMALEKKRQMLKPNRKMHKKNKKHHKKGRKGQ